MSAPQMKSQLPGHRSLSVARFDAGLINAEPKFPGKPTVHPHASFAFYLSGCATVWAGSTYRVKAGDMMIIPEGMPHYTQSADATVVLGLSICSACIASNAHGHLTTLLADVADGGSALRTVEAGSRAQLRDLLEALEQELESPGAMTELAIEGYLALVTTILQRAAPGDASPGKSLAGASLSPQALAFITQNATEGISLADVARHVHRSAAHTAAVVKEQTGHTVVEWITQSRLAVARQLLARTDDTIDSIAGRVGYESPSHFHRIFKSHHATSPGAWRRQHHGASRSGPKPGRVID